MSIDFKALQDMLELYLAGQTKTDLKLDASLSFEQLFFQ